MTDKVKLQLGDIIEIISPNDKEFNKNTYHIEYIDENKIRLEEENSGEHILTLTNGTIDNEDITQIIIKSRAEENGYARQNNLIIGVWIDIFFNGDIPLSITGKITNLEEDKIEITTYPENEKLFIDFEYKGLPDDLPIDKIKIRRAPENDIIDEEGIIEKSELLDSNDNLSTIQDDNDFNDFNDFNDSYLLDHENNDTGETSETGEIKNKENIKTFIFNPEQIHFGDDLEEMSQLVDVNEEEQRYDIQKQLDDLLDDMLSGVTTSDRNNNVKNNIHKMINRFKELREMYSKFDKNGFVSMAIKHNETHKPLIDSINNLNQHLYWILPVSRNIKKIYDKSNDDSDDEDEDDNDEDIILLKLLNEIERENIVIKKYKQNDRLIEVNKYNRLQKEIDEFYTPFNNLPIDDTNDILSSNRVNTNIISVLDNLPSFNSSQLNGKKRFAIQTYNVGNTGLEMTKIRGQPPIINRISLTKNDLINIKSILLLPEPTIRFSRINLKTCNIMDRSNLNLKYLNYWELLNNKTNIHNRTINDVNKPYIHSNDALMEKIQNYSINKDLDIEDKNNTTDNENSTYNKFLNSIIPNTKTFFDVIKPQLKGTLSINTVLDKLEPFMVYHSDLTITHYNVIKKYINDRIIDYKKRYKLKSQEYGNIKSSQNAGLPSLIKIFDENPKLKTKILDTYGFNNDTITKITNSDVIRHILNIDNGVFYNNAISLLSTNLMISDGSKDITDVDMFLNNKESLANKPNTKNSKKKYITDASECTKFKVIAKRYIEVDELMDDNDKEIYFDKKYDPTPYELKTRFKIDNTMDIGEQIAFYREKILKSKEMKEMNEINATREAESIVNNKRIIMDGEYCILELTDNDSVSIQYYIRNNQQWVLDDSIDTNIITDNTKLFCNLNEKCISVKNNCTDVNSGINEIKKHNLTLLLAEFESNLNVNKESIITTIESDLIKSDSRVESLIKIYKSALYKYDATRIAIGNTADDTMSEIVISPYQGLINTIMGENDISKRYNDILIFVNNFTRIGNSENGESNYWFYCIKTNVKILPSFIHKLATAFINGNNYLSTLNLICSQQGTISDDGGREVDKYSGYTIKMVELNESDDYTKNMSHGIIDKDAIDMANENIKNDMLKKTQGKHEMARKQSTPDATKIYNIIDSMNTNMGINLNDQKEYIVRSVLNQLSNPQIMPSKEQYAKILERTIAKGKKIDSYEIAFNSSLLFLTLSYYLISIQVSIPPIKTKTTFPGCKKSFSGFPIDDDSTNNNGLKYIACIAYKLKNNSSLPWSTISNKSSSYILKQLEFIITKYILPHEEIKNYIKEVKKYNITNPDTYIPEEHDISKWNNFLPPLKKISMKSIQDIGTVFKSKLAESLRKGSNTQLDYISEIRSKMRIYSFNIIELIEKIIHIDHVLLKSKSGEPFLENSCCYEGNNNTLKYFIDKNPEIALINNKVVNLSDMYDATTIIGRASFLYNPNNTKRKLRVIDDGFSEKTIYRAFINYCNFNNNREINEDLKALCSTKPDNFNVNDTLDESIRKLKSNARNYSEKSLHQLLNVVNNSNKTIIEVKTPVLTNIDKLSNIMYDIDKENERPMVFRSAFIKVIEQFELNELMNDTPEMRTLKNMLAKMNKNMQDEIILFVKNNSSGMKTNIFRTFKESIETITDFKETGNNVLLNKSDETNFKMINFMKNTMRSITKEYPNIIQSNVNYFEEVIYEDDSDEEEDAIIETITIPKHWGFSKKHENDIKNVMKTHYTDIKRFYGDEQINLLMKKMSIISTDIKKLSENTLFYAPIEFNNKGNDDKPFKYSVFDIGLTSLLFNFYFLTALTDLINFQHDQEIINLHIKKTNTEEDILSEQLDDTILQGNKLELSEKISNIIFVFVKMVSTNKKAINYNYKLLSDLLIRSKEKEKDNMTKYFENKTQEERDIETLFMNNRLEQWGVGQQKGLHTYMKDTYDKERDEIDRIASHEVELNKRNIVTDMNRDIFMLDMIAEENMNDQIDNEENLITYMGENDDPAEFGLDGDEEY